MKKPRLIVLNLMVFIITGAIALIGVPIEGVLNGFDSVELFTTVFLIYFSGMSITAGYHRLWSHKSYEANSIVKFVFAVGGAMALQNSILHWSSDHRVHHKHVDDNDVDPYSAKRGFWFSHIGWMLREYQPHRYSDYSNVKDLKRDKIVMWQHNYYLPIMLFANFGITGFIGWLNGDVLGMILIAGVLRLVVVHHVTFFINSLAHIWGRQPYTDKNTARDNDILAFFTFGEGYHNFHHIFEYDYRNGIKWWQWDPTKWLIRGLSYIGFTKNLRKCPEERIEKAKLEMQFLRAKAKIAKVPNKDVLIARLHEEYDELAAKMTEFYNAKKSLMDLKRKALLKTYEGIQLNYKYKELKATLAVKKDKWLELCQQQLQYA
ncbi:fatty acid desaturase [Paraneptunicella aestuarii]|uniref:acyl-CoA desaturase n=1 Tax=Paraneptunicella aestuarii TaxID=2831148 RepID=UPI001E3845F7|nr:fatty acid desaturase [Paraneptunicella aestuarii]UAA39357.1 fatty acid desaturase [Paraneptunicella aestuarii]